MRTSLLDVLLAALLAAIINVTVAGVYVFYPLIREIVTDRGGSGSGTGGGAIRVLVVTIPLSFLTIFALLRSRRKMN